MRSRRRTAALLCAPLLLTACGSAERLQPNAALATARPTPAFTASIGSPPPSPTSAAPTKAPASPGATGAASEPAPAGNANEILATAESKFEPATLEVKAGTEVTFTNAGGLHTVTGGKDAADPASPIGDNVLAAPGNSVKKTFDTPGTYDFFCTPHLSVGMKGQVVVT